VKQAIAIVLAILVPSCASAADAGHKIEYDGGSVEGLKAGASLRLYISQDRIRFVKDKEEVVIFPAQALTEISYGQDVHRRVGAAIGIGIVTFGIGALMALTKSKKHFIGVTWDDGGKKGGLAFQADKSDYRGILTGLEGVSGKKTVNTDAMGVKN